MRTSRTLSGPVRPAGRSGLAVSVLVLLLASVPSASADPPIETPAPIPGEVPGGAELLPGDGVRSRQTDGSRSLVGTFLLDPGDCESLSGTYFRMAQPGGSPDEGPFVDNGDSPCDDSSVTPLQPGSDGGLIAGEHQPHPDPAFAANSGLADRITQPQAFFGTDFAVATNPTDPQTDQDVPAPEIRVDGSGALSGDLRAFAAAWQTQHFNQGSPKPDGSMEGNTTPVTGTLDESTGRFVLEWSSQIQGGAFNNFTGVWHFEGEFAPAAADPETSSPETGSSVPPPGGDTPGDTSDDTTGGTTVESGSSSPAPAAGSTATGSLADTGGAGLSWPAVALMALAGGVVALRARLRR